MPVKCAIDAPLADSLARTEMKHPERADRFDRPREGQHHRVAGLSLLAAIVIYWNTAHPGEAVRQRKHAGLMIETDLLLTGE